MKTVVRAIICASLALICLIVAVTDMAASTAVASDGKAVAIAAGDDFSVALLDNGTVWVWGATDFAHNHMSLNKNTLPWMVPFIDHVKAISAGFGYILVLKEDGTVWAWGNNDWGQLGDGTSEYRETAVQVKNLSGVKAIKAGGGQSLALKEDGTVWAWGRGFCGQLGTGVVMPKNSLGIQNDTLNVLEPVQVNISHVKAIDAGAFFSAAIKDDGTVWTWGQNGEGELGDGSLDDRPVPIQALISDVTAISCGHSYTLALKNDGTVWGWGSNSNYQLGNRSNSLQSSPVKVDELSDAVAIAAGSMSSYAVRKDGTVWAWGESNQGKLGDGYYFHRSSFDPVEVIGLRNAKAVAAGYNQALSLLADGSVWTWGSGWSITSDGNQYGGRPVPYQVSIGPRSELTISATPHPVSFSSSTPLTSAPAPSLENSSAGAIQWTANTEEPVQYIAPASGDQMYTFYKNNISLFKGGERVWSIEIPDRWVVTTGRDRTMYNDPSSAGGQSTSARPIIDISDGYLYIYAIPVNAYRNNVYNDQNWEDPTANGREWDLIAIAPNGTIAWTLPLNTTAYYTDESVIRARGDSIYVFHCYNETVVDRNGSVLFTLPNVASPAALDEAGNLYAVPASSRDWYVNKVNGNGLYISSADYRIPGSTIQSYYPNGTLRWSRDTGAAITRPYIVDEIRPLYGTLPVCVNDILYVPLKRGVIAYDTEGRKLWSKSLTGDYYDFFELMPVDSYGNVYLRAENFTGNSADTTIYVISDNGTQVSSPRKYVSSYSGVTRTSAKDGILYDICYAPAKAWGENRTIEDLDTYVVSAIDLIHNRTLWSYKMPVDKRYTTQVDSTMLYSTIIPLGDESIAKDYLGGTGAGWTGSIAVIDTYPTEDRVYINFRSVGYKTPIVLNQTYCVYSGGIYYIDTKGNVLYGSQTDRPVTAMAVNNSTVYYSSGDGKISSTVISIASGLTLLAIGAITLKFLFAGTIARARSRLDKNENRLYILKYIVDHPGLTSYELARGLSMNHGTIRYHLFILGNNHRIATFKDDNRYVRYFPNAGKYSQEEQIIISLMRRESVGRIIGLILQKPGISNGEIARELGIPDSLSSRYLKELVEKGIVTKPENGNAFQISNRCQLSVARIAELI